MCDEVEHLGQRQCCLLPTVFDFENRWNWNLRRRDRYQKLRGRVSLSLTHSLIPFSFRSLLLCLITQNSFAFLISSHTFLSPIFSLSPISPPLATVRFTQLHTHLPPADCFLYYSAFTNSFSFSIISDSS